MKKLMKNFFLCGTIGWCYECFFTGMNALFKKKDRTLRCQTSIWMFPIYGSAACFTPLIRKMKHLNVLLRGSIYTASIYVIEFTTGTLLKYMKACPWDYSKAKYNYKGVVRFDYIPAWILLGFIFERCLLKKKK